jgi:hypothetical protein
VKGIVALNADQFVPGHGNLQTKEGKSLDEIRQAVGDAPPPAPGGRGPNFPSFTQVVYQELTKK